MACLPTVVVATTAAATAGFWILVPLRTLDVPAKAARAIVAVAALAGACAWQAEHLDAGLLRLVRLLFPASRWMRHEPKQCVFGIVEYPVQWEHLVRQQLPHPDQAEVEGLGYDHCNGAIPDPGQVGIVEVDDLLHFGVTQMAEIKVSKIHQYSCAGMPRGIAQDALQVCIESL